MILGLGCILSVSAGFLLGGQWALRRVRSGRHVTKRRLGYIAPHTASQAVHLLHHLPRDQQIILLLGISATLSDAEIENISPASDHYSVNDMLTHAEVDMIGSGPPAQMSVRNAAGEEPKAMQSVEKMASAFRVRRGPRQIDLT